MEKVLFVGAICLTMVSFSWAADVQDEAKNYFKPLPHDAPAIKGNIHSGKSGP